MPKAGVMSVAQANAWAEALRRDSEAGLFFGASNYYGYVARRDWRPPPSVVGRRAKCATYLLLR
jgi:hypothetical protein